VDRSKSPGRGNAQGGLRDPENQSLSFKCPYSENVLETQEDEDEEE
jgi:hypothetical protein